VNELTLRKSTILTRWTKAYEHGIITPSIVGDAIFLEGSRENFPCRVIQTDFEALEVVSTLLPIRFIARRLVRIRGVSLILRLLRAWLFSWRKLTVATRIRLNVML